MILLSCQLMRASHRSLEDIEKQSQALLGKGKAARLLDKARDSGTVVKLVEELRQVLLVYQVSVVGSSRLGLVELTCFG